ncbi:MAG: polyphosphate polymerase domain-containing protein [Actinomycetota bacterium]
MTLMTDPAADMIGRAVDEAVGRFESTGLQALNRRAKLQIRKDRKYVLDATELVRLLDALPTDTRALEIDGRRWFRYESVYFDTDRFDSYRLAAIHRPSRFKVRTRTYLDSGLAFAEVKTKDRRGRTVKHRLRVDDGNADTGDVVRDFAGGVDEASSYADDLEPVLISRYRRATLLLSDVGVRVTIDADYRCIGADRATTGLTDEFIVEVKSDGRPSIVDHLLWRGGHRPVKISKYATGLAALHPELAANRWQPVLAAHFGRG